MSNLDVHLAAQCQHHRRDALCHIHPSLQIEVDGGFVGFGIEVEVHAVLLATEVFVELVGIERCKWRKQLGDRHQTGVERRVGRAFVIAHILAPETLAIQSHIPVRQVVVHELVDEATCTRRVVVLQLDIDFLDERIDARENPTVDFGL